jgi:hypothetical protein
LVRKNNKNSLQRKHIKRKQLSNQHTETFSGTQSTALRMQQCAQACHSNALDCGSTLDDALPDLHPGCLHLSVLHSGRTASFEWESANLQPPGPPANHAQNAKPEVTQPPQIIPAPVANLLPHLLQHTTH